MQLKSRALKAPAWQAMRAAVPPAILVTLAYFLLTDLVSNVTSLLTPAFTVDDLIYRRGAGIWTALFLSVLLGLYRVVMDFGYQVWALRTARGQQAGFGSLLDGFGMAGRVLLMELHIFLRVLGWTLALSLAYSFLMFLAVPIGRFAAAPAIIMMVVLSVLFYAAVIAISLRYALAPFLLADYPDAGSAAAVRRSAEMVHGNLWSLFKLHLSFWPWYLGQMLLELIALGAVLASMAGELSTYALAGDLSMLTAQIQQAMGAPLTTLLSLLATIPLVLFFLPYQRIAVVNFYRALSGEPVAPSFSGETF